MPLLMHVAKWGNSLAVRLPKSVVEALGLKEGDSIELRAVDNGVLEVSRDLTKDNAIMKLRKLRRPFPANYSFDRDEANER